MQTLELPQGQIRYRVAGPADTNRPPVVFVHGLLVNGELWTGVADALAAQGIRSYAPDLPLGAHSLPLNPDADLSPRGVARLLIALLEALELTDVTLVGNDTGGALCQFLLDIDQSRIGRLVLTNCDAFDKFPPAPFNLLVKAGRRPGVLRALANPMRWTWVRNSALGYGPLVRKPLDPELTRRWSTPLLTNADVRRDSAKFLRGINPKELLGVSTRLGQFDKPVTLAWGDSDRFFPLSFAERLRDAFPHARLVPIAGAKTFVPLDEPERVAGEVATTQLRPA